MIFLLSKPLLKSKEIASVVFTERPKLEFSVTIYGVVRFVVHRILYTLAQPVPNASVD